MVGSIDVPIIGDSNKVPQDDPSYTLNLYAEKVSNEVFTLKPRPGIELHAQFSIGGGGRGLIALAGRLFGVRGGFFQEIVSGSPVVRGALASTSGIVDMGGNIKPDDASGQIILVDDTKGYVFDLSDNTFVTLTLANNFLGGGAQVAVCAGKAYVFKPGTTSFQSSNAYNFKVWNDTAFTSMQSLNTPLLSLISNGDLLYGFSADGFEVWQEDGASITLLSVRQILSGDRIGILSPHSAVFIERYAYWLGRTSTGQGVVYRHTGGGAPERISNHSTERQIASYATPSDAVSDTYTSLGHVFYLTTFQGGNATLVWDKSTNLWHDRLQRDPNSGYLFALPYFSLVILDGNVYGIDQRDGTVWRLDDTIYTDAGDPIIRERILSVIPKEGDWQTFCQSAELFGENGNTPVGQDDPNIMMQYSTDRGKTWSQEQWQKSGGDGTYAGRTRWVGIGSAFGFAFWFRIVASQYVSWRLVRLRME